MTSRILFLQAILIFAAILSSSAIPACGQDTTTLLRKAQSGNVDAEFELGQRYEKSKNETQARRWYLKAATNGHSRAQMIIGIDFKYGELGLQRDMHEAARWFRKAARQNVKEAQSDLSEMLSLNLISATEANWISPKSTAKSQPKAFSLIEIEKGLRGGIATKRLIILIQEFNVNFTLNANSRDRLIKAGADDALLYAISVGNPSFRVIH